MYTVAELIADLQRLDQDEVVLSLGLYTVNDILDMAYKYKKDCSRETASTVLRLLDLRAMVYDLTKYDVVDAVKDLS